MTNTFPLNANYLTADASADMGVNSGTERFCALDFSTDLKHEKQETGNCSFKVLSNHIDQQFLLIPAITKETSIDNR